MDLIDSSKWTEKWCHSLSNTYIRIKVIQCQRLQLYLCNVIVSRGIVKPLLTSVDHVYASNSLP